MTGNRFKLQWRVRVEPRKAKAVAASAETAKNLARKLLASSDSSLAAWEGVSTPDLLILLGDAESLPWVDGVSYLGSDPSAPHLLLPTNRDPGLPLDLLEQALIERSPYPPPLAVLEKGSRVVSLAQARELSRARLEAWLNKGPSAAS